MATGGGDPTDYLLNESHDGFACRECGFRSSTSRDTSEIAHRNSFPNCRGAGGFLEPDAAAVTLARRISTQGQHRDQDRRSRDVELRRQSYVSHRPVDLGDLGQGLASLNLSGTVQQRVDVARAKHISIPSNAVSKRQLASNAIRSAQNPTAPMVVSTCQQSDEDILCQLRCGICFARWKNLVLLCCRHLICDVCFSKCSSKCGLCRDIVKGIFPIRFHSMDMIGDINVPVTLNDERDNVQLFVSMEMMGYSREIVRRVIHHCASDGKTGPLTENDILDKLELLQREDGPHKDLVDSVYCFPTPEELEIIPSVSADRKKFSRWLQVAEKCLICRVRDACICLFPCHHLAICFECNQGPHKPESCPDRRCGKKIKNQVKIHL